MGDQLRPDGRGYDIEGLHPVPSTDSVDPNVDKYGAYLYQHKGMYSYSPKNGAVFAIRPNRDQKTSPNGIVKYQEQKTRITWYETDEMNVDWPFEIDQYRIDWPSDSMLFVRGDKGDGRSIFIPSDYSAELQGFQEPEGHAVAVSTDGEFRTKGVGDCLLKLTGNDNIWFVPIRSISRMDEKYFITNAVSEWVVGQEITLRGGSVSGVTPNFYATCMDAAISPGYIYKPVSGNHYNPKLYHEPSATSENEYPSVIYAVNTSAKPIEVWWNSLYLEDDMPMPLEVPSLPQRYQLRWPTKNETPQIVIASQKGSAGESMFLQNLGLDLDDKEASVEIAGKSYFSPDGGTIQFWVRVDDWGKSYLSNTAMNASFLTIGSSSKDQHRIIFDLQKTDTTTNNIVITVSDKREQPVADIAPIKLPIPTDTWDGWFAVAVRFNKTSLDVFLNGKMVVNNKATTACASLLNFVNGIAIGKYGHKVYTDSNGNPTMVSGGRFAREGVQIGELLLWHGMLSPDEIKKQMRLHHTGEENALSACFTFLDGVDLNVKMGSDERVIYEKVGQTPYTAYKCLAETCGPPAEGNGLVTADLGTTPYVYYENTSGATGYNPNEEHAFMQASDDGYVAWALRADLNTAKSSEPGVLVSYVRSGRPAMKFVRVKVTDDKYPRLEGTATAGLALPGPHPLDLLENPWMQESRWDGSAAQTPFHRDRKGQFWARAKGKDKVYMYYPNQPNFAYPSQSSQPATGAAIAWLSKWSGNPDKNKEKPSPWTWIVSWPENIPEIEIGRTLTTAASGLPEVWNAKSMAMIWPGTQADRDAVATLFDPTVIQSAGFNKRTPGFGTMSEAIATLNITVGKGGNAHLRKGKYYFDGLPPSISERFYLDTTADVTKCLKLAGQKEDNPGGVSLLHINVLADDERKAIKGLIDHSAWSTAVDNLAKEKVVPNVSGGSVQEEVVNYRPRDKYALFTNGARNYITLIENDARNKEMGVADGDPISMHIMKVVPKYYTGRIVTRKDPLNLLSQQLSIIYEEAFAGNASNFIFEWRKCAPNSDGTVPKDFDNYQPKFTETGLTKFVTGQQGDTLANMVNTYYSMRYKAKSGSPAHKVMGDQWSSWVNPPALAEGWVQRVLNSVTPFTQRMQDLYENEAENAVTMIRQAGAPYEGDVALNQDNLTSVGLLQLYETILNKAESMSLLMKLNDAGANKQLQLAVGRLAELYNVLGDEAYADALNPTIGFGTENETKLSEYGALSSSLFCFDNQVANLLDEELALLRGRDGENAPDTSLSPYYNRLVWNFTRGMSAGEVAYAVNYDISGNKTSTIDYNQAAQMFPQGHGDAYGHYLSALSGYYRLLRNPYFSWGEPAMGEMVVADSVVNVDYFDESLFAKSAVNVAKTALDVVDRTARAASRDSGNTVASAGYLDADKNGRAFGYGEWGARGGFGALCNWAVGNSLVPEEPKSGLYYRYYFTGMDSSLATTLADNETMLLGNSEAPWTVEFQLVPSIVGALSGGSTTNHVVMIEDDTSAVGFELVDEGADLAQELRLAQYDKHQIGADYETFTVNYTNATSEKADRSLYKIFASTNHDARTVVEYLFAVANPPVRCEVPQSLANKVEETVAGCFYDGNLFISTNTVFTTHYRRTATTELGSVSNGVNSLIAFGYKPDMVFVGVSNFVAGVDVRVLDREGRKTFAQSFTNLNINVRAKNVTLGGGYMGEVGEFRMWQNDYVSDADLITGRAGVAAGAAGSTLVHYLRTVSPTKNVSALTAENNDTPWGVTGGEWIAEEASGMDVDFNPEGLKRIDRATVTELTSLAEVANSIQKKIDQLDGGMNPLGLASEAIPFDLTPIGVDDGTSTHFEQIRARADTALQNARKVLDKAQTAGNRLRLIEEAQQTRQDKLDTMELEYKNKLIGYFGYPYAGDIGPGGTYEQGYDGADLYHYAWMEPAKYGLTDEVHTKTYSVVTYTTPDYNKVINYENFNHYSLMTNYYYSFMTNDSTSVTDYYNITTNDSTSATDYYNITTNDNTIVTNYYTIVTNYYTITTNYYDILTNYYSVITNDYSTTTDGKTTDTTNNSSVTNYYNNVTNVITDMLTEEGTPKTLTFERSASGIVLKPSTITGKRYADGKIQEALGEFLIAYANVEGAIDAYDKYTENLHTVYTSVATTLEAAANVSTNATLLVENLTVKFERIDQLQKNILAAKLSNDTLSEIFDTLLGGIPEQIGLWDVPVRPFTAAAFGWINVAQELVLQGLISVWGSKKSQQEEEINKAQAEFDNLCAQLDFTNAKAGSYETLWSAWEDQYNAEWEVETAFRELIAAQQKVETVVAEARRILEERELARQQAVNEIAKERYKEMFFRLMRNNALTRYSTAFDLAQKYTYLTAQAYDYETGLVSADKQSGAQFMGEIIGARTLGEFDKDGKVMVTSGDGDGGLSDILARMDANWLVLKPRLGINNPQPYATWFSLRRELFRINAGESGDDAWKTELRKYWVDDLSKVKEFTYHCQPFHRDSASVMPEPGLVIPFSSDITFGRNFFGNKLTGGDAALDSSWYATHIKAAGVYFEGYNESVNGYSGSLPLAQNPVAYLVPVGSDCMRLAGDAGSLISWNVVDQTIPAPFTIGSTELDDPDWVPLFTGYTAGNDAGARIRKHPSFRAYYGNAGSEPNDSYLDCTRLVGRSAWNTKWLLVIPAGAMDSDREKALGAFIEGFDANRDGTTDVSGVKDIRIGLKTYSKAGN